MGTARKVPRTLAIWPLLLLVAADLFGPALARSASARHAVGKKHREFDYFALALQWPGTICASTRHCCAANGCCRSEPLQTFTIHGLWPDYDDGTWPACCRHTSFDMDKILPLKPTLEKYWPSLYCSSSSTCFSGKGPFWAHEVIDLDPPTVSRSGRLIEYMPKSANPTLGVGAIPPSSLL